MMSCSLSVSDAAGAPPSSTHCRRTSPPEERGSLWDMYLGFIWCIYIYTYVWDISILYMCVYMGYLSIYLSIYIYICRWDIAWIGLGEIWTANHCFTIEYADWISKMSHHPILRLDMSSEIATLIDAWMLDECLFDDRRELVHVNMIS